MTRTKAQLWKQSSILYSTLPQHSTRIFWDYLRLHLKCTGTTNAFDVTTKMKKRTIFCFSSRRLERKRGLHQPLWKKCCLKRNASLISIPTSTWSSWYISLFPLWRKNQNQNECSQKFSAHQLCPLPLLWCYNTRCISLFRPPLEHYFSVVTESAALAKIKEYTCSLKWHDHIPPRPPVRLHAVTCTNLAACFIVISLQTCYNRCNTTKFRAVRQWTLKKWVW